MQTKLSFALLCFVIFTNSCSRETKPAGPEYRPTSTIKDIMDSMVDPSADFVWESVASTLTPKGWQEKFPRTDEEWKEVRRRAITVLEASNLLLMPGRRVAKPGEKADFPEVEESPEQIQALIDMDRAGWDTRAHGLHDAAADVLKAIDAKNAEQVLATGDKLDRACENCHAVYWYPRDKSGLN